MITKANSNYVVKNTIRLVIVGCSISFFMIFTLLEIVQNLMIAFVMVL